ncbi:MAG: V-type ATP synthase subunit F [Polyangiaceae bacterium]
MELTVRVLCGPAVAGGFELAGLKVEEADERTAGDAMRRLATDKATGIVLVEERLRRALPAELMQRLDRLGTLLVVPFPTPTWGAARVEEEYVLEILRQAVGYRVRPR